MRFEQLTSVANLQLAWRRITTGRNYQYKRYFRGLYHAYETALDDNLRELHRRLQGSYQATSPTRVYVPKPSGLQRPLSLLALEDQIAYQSIANLVARRVARSRHPLLARNVFSSIPEDDPNSIFFLRNWQEGYYKFQRRIEWFFRRGFHWVAQLDLAAFYDTISHNLLLQVACPKSGDARSREWISRWLEKWSTDRAEAGYAHGIPQGPIASDFLAECVLLPIDKSMAHEFRYARYVDDIRLFGKSEIDARRAAVRLEVLCRERGLIPQAKKHATREATSLQEAMGALPSIPPPEDQWSDRTVRLLAAKDAVAKFQTALSKTRPQVIKDKSRARYVLYHAEPSSRLLSYVLRFVPRHPEHVDAFVHFLSNYKRSTRVIRLCREQVRDSPYEYVQGEFWHILARMMKPAEMRRMLRDAIGVATSRSSWFAAKWGACHFLCAAENAGIGRYGRYLKYQSNDLLLALLAPVIPTARYVRGEVVEKMLRERSFEAGITLASPLGRKGMTHATFGIPIRALRSQVQNVFRAVGIITRRSGGVDPMAEILARRCMIDAWPKWRKLFGREYVHGLQLLAQADPVFDSGRSLWLALQNSFNHAVFLAMQRHLSRHGLAGAVRTIGKSGQAVPFGALVGSGQPFDAAHPIIARGFRKANDRRNKLPGSHPYEFKGGARTTYLRKKEQKQLVRGLARAYRRIIREFDPIL